MTPFMIRTGSWDELQNDAKLIREQVFKIGRAHV